MPDYDFACYECEVYTTITCGMNDTERRENIECPKCKDKMKRIFTVPNAIIKSTFGSDMKLTKNQAIVDVDGQPVRLNFVDHGEQSGLVDGSIAKKYPGARMDEATGKVVVDVVSNVKDPLGKIERAKKKGDVDIKKKQIGQKYKLKGG